MEREDFNRLWSLPSPKGSDRICTISFKDQRDIIIRMGRKVIRYGPLRSVIIDPQRSRYILIFESEYGDRDSLSIPNKGVDKLLFWPSQLPSDLD